MPKPRVNLIAAIGKSGQIGLDNKLPWHNSDDLKWFKVLTMGHTLIVGARTAETLPPLPGRTLLVMGREDTPESMLANIQAEEVWIIGGAATYAKWYDYVDRFFISQIDYDGHADTYFQVPPAMAKGLWHTAPAPGLPTYRELAHIFCDLLDGTQDHDIQSMISCTESELQAIIKARANLRQYWLGWLSNPQTKRG